MLSCRFFNGFRASVPEADLRTAGVCREKLSYKEDRSSTPPAVRAFIAQRRQAKLRNIRSCDIGIPGQRQPVARALMHVVIITD